jgi:hypothetical protein
VAKWRGEGSNRSRRMRGSCSRDELNSGSPEASDLAAPMRHPPAPEASSSQAQAERSSRSSTENAQSKHGSTGERRC